MNGSPDRPIRESAPEAIELPVDPEEIARNEARNTLRQSDAITDLVESALKSDDSSPWRDPHPDPPPARGRENEGDGGTVDAPPP